MGQEYYLCVDVGASKALFAVFQPDGQLVASTKIKTSPDFKQFQAEVKTLLKNDLAKFRFSYACFALPGWIDYAAGSAVAFGNLAWKEVSVSRDLAPLLPRTRVLFNNDAKLAGLSEAILLHKKYKKVMYLTLSTGIGGGIIINDLIAQDFANFEPGQMVFEYDGQARQWEDFASGRALKAVYGKLASEIEDPAIWREYAARLAVGFEDLLATIQPDAVIIGGGVGAHFEKFKPFLEEELAKFKNPLVPLPPLLKAKRPEEAVIYGCYEYIKQHR